MTRGQWPTMLTALVEEHPGKSTMELTRLVAWNLAGAALERKRKAVHQALTRLVARGGIGCAVGIEWVNNRRTMVARWYPLDTPVPEPTTGRTLVLDAVKHFGRAVPSAIHRRTGLAYSKLYRLCRQLAAEGALLNVATPPLQCWVLPDGDLTPFEVPAHYRPLHLARAALAARPKDAPRKPRVKPAAESPRPYINPIRARALGLSTGVRNAR